MAVFQSVFDIIGPVMVGPSSSHTAGAVRIGLAARSIFGEKPEEVVITFFGSFGHTYRGHGTDIAMIAGLLGKPTASEEIRHAYKLAEKEGMRVEVKVSDRNAGHPNTAQVVMHAGDRTMSITARSIGGGMIDLVEVDGFNVHVSCDNPVVLIFHRDRPGLIATVTRFLAEYEVNVSQMEVSRKERGSQALMIVATDGTIPQEVTDKIRDIRDVGPIIFLSALKREPDLVPIDSIAKQKGLTV